MRVNIAGTVLSERMGGAVTGATPAQTAFGHKMSVRHPCAFPTLACTLGQCGYMAPRSLIEPGVYHSSLRVHSTALFAAAFRGKTGLVSFRGRGGLRCVPLHVRHCTSRSWTDRYY